MELEAITEAETEEEVEEQADVKAEVEVEVATFHVSEMVVPTAEDFWQPQQQSGMARGPWMRLCKQK